MAEANERWLEDIRVGDWIDLGDYGPFPEKVSNLIPVDHYEAFARVLHPLYFDGRHGVRWEDVARRNGRTYHRQMSFACIFTKIDDDIPTSGDLYRNQAVGMLPAREWIKLGRLLRSFTESTECVVGCWEGRGGLPPEAAYNPLLEFPNRRYALAQISFDLWSSSAILRDFSPSLVWPADRAWFLNTDIDFVSTYVGGSGDAIRALVERPDLEALLVEPTDGVQWYADTLNPPPRGERSPPYRSQRWSGGRDS